MENLPAFPVSFSELLKTYRKRKGLTQRRLAQQLGVHGNTISSWELGTYLPATHGLVLELARCLELDEPEARRLLEASLTALAPYWYVPFPRNPFFTGREETLKMLHTSLSTHRMTALTQSYALHGLGGVGKTQLALEYTYQHALEYSAVFWIGAETEEQMIFSLLRIAEVLQLPEREDKDQQRVIAAAQRWLSTHSQWLLIWDNVENLDLIASFLPSVRQGAILITTRCQVLGTFAGGIDLFPMEQEEGMLFLLRRAKVLELEASREYVQRLAVQMPHQYTTAAELVTAMGGLPLALDQAGAYIEETQCDLLTYLDLFRTQRAVLLHQRGERSRTHPEPVSTTLTLAVTVTSSRHPAVRNLLQICALLSPNAIPEEFFREGSDYLDTQIQTVCRDPLSWNQLVAAACSYSLLQRRPEEHTLSMHRLVQAVLVDAMPAEERARWSRRVITTLEALFPEVSVATAYAAWKQCERLLPHTLLCFHRAADDEPSLTLASLACKTAQYLHVRGRYTEAEPLFRQTLTIWEQILGPASLALASPLTNLATLYWEQGKYAQAEPLYRRALRIWEQALGPTHAEVARALNGLANLYWSRGQYAEAEPLFRRALQIREQALGSEHPEIVSPLGNLASICAEQGRNAEAEPLFQRALAISEQALGADHPLVAFCLNNLAEFYRAQGQYAQAERLHQRALHLREGTLGADHPLVAFTLNNLAELYAEQRQDTQAESFHQRALHIWERALGADHPECARALTGLATLSRERGQHTEAERLYQRALAIREQSLGPDHPLLAQLLNHLANLYRDQGEETKAEGLYQRALAIREQGLGHQHPETAETLQDLASLRQQQGTLKEAASLYRRALSIREQVSGSSNPKTSETRERLHAVLVTLERIEEIEEREEAQPQPAETKEVEKNEEMDGAIRRVRPSCPHCQSNSAVVKSGTNHSGSQRFRCQCCQHYFTPQSAPHGYERTRKKQAVLLAEQGKSYRFIARQLGVNHRTIRAWIIASERDGDRQS
jgi:tetratricopeptide (TPR) repeat protein/transcriptional regulator with XRE-family HTH domain